MCRRRTLLRFLAVLTAAATWEAAVVNAAAAPTPAALQEYASSQVPQYFGTASGWSYRGSAAEASASTLLLSRKESGVVLIFCDGSRIGFHLSLGTTDRRSLTGAEDGLLQVYAANETPTALPKVEATPGAQRDGDFGQDALKDQQGEQQEVPGQDVSEPEDAMRDESVAFSTPPELPPLAQFRIRFFSDAEFRSLPLRQPEWDSPDRLLEIIRDHPGGLRLVVTRLRQTRFTSTHMADLYLPDDSDGSGLAKETALAFLERDCRTGLKSDDTDAGGQPVR